MTAPKVAQIKTDRNKVGLTGLKEAFAEMAIFHADATDEVSGAELLQRALKKNYNSAYFAGKVPAGICQGVQKISVTCLPKLTASFANPHPLGQSDFGFPQHANDFFWIISFKAHPDLPFVTRLCHISALQSGSVLRGKVRKTCEIKQLDVITGFYFIPSADLETVALSIERRGLI